MLGLDYNSLEDYISALTTKDPNKLKVYEMGFDGHSLRAASYFKDQLPPMDLDDPNQVNAIKKTHEELRQLSKAPTFALTYGGTYITLMNNCGFSEQQAKFIEANYHDLYKVSDEWVQDKIKQACEDGYVTVAFGLRVRTPLLAQSVYTKLSYKAAAEARTAGNALGQSWGLLNTRACNKFMQDVWDSPYAEDIRIIAQIHDASYYIIPNNIDIVKFINDNLVKHVQWQEHPDIQHPTVKLGGEVDIFYPSWKYSVTLPNNASLNDIIELAIKHKQELENQ